MDAAKPIRMKKRKMFVHVADKGFKVVVRGLVVVGCPNESSAVRIGFTTTKKLGCAVVRNRIRRRMRELVRTCPRISDFVGYDLVFIGRVATHDMPFSDLQINLSNALDTIYTHFSQGENNANPV